MDFSSLDSGEWLEIPRTVEGKSEPIRLKISWMTIKEATSFSKIESDEDGLIESLDLIASHIIEWNLQSGGKDIPCTQENKDRYIQALISVKLNGVGKGMTVGKEIISFCTNQSNYTKN